MKHLSHAELLTKVLAILLRKMREEGIDAAKLFKAAINEEEKRRWE